LLSPAERERSSTCYSCPLPLALSPAECLLCRRVEADPDICGDKQEKYGLCAHVFCLVSGSGHSLQHSKKRVGLLGFLPRDIQLAVRRAAQKHCCVCGQSGATILCCKEGCDRWFHLPCAKEGGCVTQPGTQQVLSSIRPSAAPSAETVRHSLSKCSFWGSEPPLGWCPSV
uniref:PHD-type domain-containing protein n=1 Tax=Cyanistes caeruleus TaxID=156563 RepID=A0A8C0UD25_CYACU